MKNRKRQKGFTLIELIVVIAILGILAMVAIPRFAGLMDNAKDKANIATATTLGNAAEVYFANEESHTLSDGTSAKSAALITALVDGNYIRPSNDYDNFTLELTDEGLAEVTYTGGEGSFDSATVLFPQPPTT